MRSHRRASFNFRAIALSLLLLGYALSAAAQSFTTAPFLPLANGNSWTYQLNGVGGYVRTVSGTQVINGLNTAIITYSPEGDLAYFSNDGSGIRQHQSYSAPEFLSGCNAIVSETDTFSPPITIAPATWSIGQTVNSSGILTAELGVCGTYILNYSSASTAVAQELVTVPAGQFLAAKIHVTNSFSGSGISGTVDQTSWVAPDVGLVKEIEIDASGTTTVLMTGTNIIRTYPDAFAFATQSGTAVNSPVTSNAVTITGTTAPAALSVAGGQYSINGGAWTSAAGTVSNGQTVALALTTAPTPGTVSAATLTVGGVSATFSATTAADVSPPGIPSGITATAAGSTQIDLGWSASTDNVGVAGYKVYRAGSLIATLGNVTSYSNTGLTASTAYSYTVQACDAAGNCSVQSASASATTAAPSMPGAPAGVNATPGNTQATVSFSPPASNGGAAITSYTVTSSPGGYTASGSASPITVTGLSNGTAYTFTVTATNSVGTSAASAASNSVTPSTNPTFTPALVLGFNLLGNSLNTSLDVMSVFGNQTSPVSGVTDNIATVWKWDAANLKWQFYSPLLTTLANAAYAASHNYDVLTSIAAGEGYWVNSLTPMNLPLQTGAAFNWNSFNYVNLPSGFNLIAHAGPVTPSQFNVNVSVTPPGVGAVATDNFATLWAWDASNVTWFFYSPLLESSGGLAAVKSYADSHFFEHFQDFNKKIEMGVGFWVNKF